MMLFFVVVVTLGVNCAYKSFVAKFKTTPRNDSALFAGIAVSDGGSLSVGQTQFGEDTDGDLAVHILKYSALGAFEWGRKVLLDYDEFFGLVELSDGSFLSLGYSSYLSAVEAFVGVSILKVSSSGNVDAAYYVGDGSDDYYGYGISVVEESPSLSIVVGGICSEICCIQKLTFGEIDNVDWSKEFGSMTCQVNAMKVSGDYVYVTGNNDGYGVPVWFVMKISLSNGEKEWVKYIDGTTHGVVFTECYGLDVVDDSIVSVCFEGNREEQNSGYLAKLSTSDGSTEYVKKFTGDQSTSNEIPLRVVGSTDGEVSMYYVGGSFQYNDAGSEDATIWSFDASTGGIEKCISVTGDYDDIYNAISVRESDGRIFGFGWEYELYEVEGVEDRSSLTTLHDTDLSTCAATADHSLGFSVTDAGFSFADYTSSMVLSTHSVTIEESVDKLNTNNRIESSSSSDYSLECFEALPDDPPDDPSNPDSGVENIIIFSLVMMVVVLLF